MRTSQTRESGEGVRYLAEGIARAKSWRQKTAWDMGGERSGGRNCKQLGFARHGWTWGTAGRCDTGHGLTHPPHRIVWLVGCHSVEMGTKEELRRNEMVRSPSISTVENGEVMGTGFISWIPFYQPVSLVEAFHFLIIFFLSFLSLAFVSTIQWGDQNLITKCSNL